MIMNKKAQNLTQPYVIILIIVIVSILTIAFNTFGDDVASTPGNSLGDDSLDRIYSNAGFVPSVVKNNTNDTKDLFFSSPSNSSGSLKDFTLEFQFFREQSSTVRSMIQDAWELPQFFVSGLDLDQEEWKVFLNLFSTLIWTLFLYAIFRIIRGLF